MFFKHWTNFLKNNNIGFKKYRYIEYMTVKIGRKKRKYI